MEYLELLVLSLVILPLPWLRNIYFAKDCPINDKIIKQRLVYFDFLKGLAIMAVILIHVTYYFYTYPYTVNNLAFIYIVNNLARFAIPVFIICSGILLNPVIDKNRYIDFYRRKLWRIFLPYILCVIVYALALHLSIFDFFSSLISGQIVAPYYFIIILLELYLIYPVLDIYKKSEYFLWVAFFISLISGFFIQLQYISGIPTFLPYFFFFCYGIRCREKFLEYRKNKKEMILWLSIAIFYFIFIFFKPEWYFNVRLFYGLAILNLFFYFKDKLFKENIFDKIIISFGQNSLWIYLIHFVLIAAVYYYCSLMRINCYLNFVLVYLLSLLVSFLLAKAIQLLYDYTIINILKFNIKR